MAPTRAPASTLAILALAISACHSTLSGGPVRTDPMGLPIPSTTRPDLAPPDRTSQPSSGSRQLCRGRMLAGWIAVDYVEAPKVCPPQSSESEQYMGAVAVQYELLTDHAELLVCSGQGVPRGWIRRPLPDSTLAGSRCPTSRREVPAAKRVMLIQRLP